MSITVFDGVNIDAPVTNTHHSSGGGFLMNSGPTTERFACRNCRRPIYLVQGIGWLHGELPQYAGEPITCETAQPMHATEEGFNPYGNHST